MRYNEAMKFKKVLSEKAPKPYGKNAATLGVVAAGVMTVMALLQLVRFDKFLPELDFQLPGGYGFAIFVATVIVFAEIFAIPFLLRMNLSKLARFCSGLLVLLPVWIWLIVSIWSTGNDVVAVQFSTYFPLSTGWWTIVLNAAWLAFNFYVVWRLGFDKIYPAKTQMLKKTRK